MPHIHFIGIGGNIAAGASTRGQPLSERDQWLAEQVSQLEVELNESENAVKDFTAQVTADHPAIDILIANAGTIRRAPAVEHSDEDWDLVISQFC